MKTSTMILLGAAAAGAAWFAYVAYNDQVTRNYLAGLTGLATLHATPKPGYVYVNPKTGAAARAAGLGAKITGVVVKPPARGPVDGGTPPPANGTHL